MTGPKGAATREGRDDVSEQNLQLAIIIGSTREGRIGGTVGNWFVPLAKQHGALDVNVLDLLDHDLPPHLLQHSTPAVEQFAAHIGAADAVVVITPEYNHSFPAALKQAIDSVKEEWQAKPIAFVAYGGISGGLRSVEHLRGVFAELHAVTIRDTVSLPNVHSLFNEDGRLKDPKGPEEAVTTMLNHLTWWANALRAARNGVPYGTVASIREQKVVTEEMWV